MPVPLIAVGAAGIRALMIVRKMKKTGKNIKMSKAEAEAYAKIRKASEAAKNKVKKTKGKVKKKVTEIKIDLKNSLGIETKGNRRLTAKETRKKYKKK